LRWLAYRESDGSGAVRAWDENNTEARAWCRRNGMTFLGLRTEIDDASALLGPMKSTEKQSETMLRRLALSVALGGKSHV
jgi:hypothetical protein